MDEEIIDWRKEATGVINDVNPFVNEIVISNQLKVQNGEIGVYMNVETKEGKKHTVLLCNSGFKVVANDYDQLDQNLEEINQFYETPYSLLQSISPSYNQEFSKLLIEKLEKLNSS